MIDKDNFDLDVKFSNYFDEYRIKTLYNDLIKSEKLSFIRMKELNKKFDKYEGEVIVSKEKIEDL